MKFDEGYFTVSLKECREDFVSVSQRFRHAGVKVYFRQNNGYFYVRRKLIQPLIRAAKIFSQHGLYIRFESCYRTIGKQRALFKKTLKQTTRTYPGLNVDALVKIAGIFVASKPATAAHMAGAAVDITLLDRSGHQIDLGGEYLRNGPEIVTHCQNIPGDARRNRQILISTMEKCGFVNYPYEFWHFCMGDRIAAYLKTERYAVYGPCVFTPRRGIVRFISNKEQWETFTSLRLKPIRRVMI